MHAGKSAGVARAMQVETQIPYNIPPALAPGRADDAQSTTIGTANLFNRSAVLIIEMLGILNILHVEKPHE